MAPRPALAAALVLAAAAGSGCRGAPADDPSAGDRRHARAVAQEAAATLIDGAEETLPARAAVPVARWEGCTSAFPEGWETVRWSVEARLDLDAGAPVRPPYLAPLRPVLADAGFAPVTRAPAHAPFSTLAGERDGVEATITHTGAGRFVLLAVRGDCVAAGDGQDGVG